MYVAQYGTDEEGCGSEDKPCNSIKYGISLINQTNSAIIVGNGTYTGENNTNLSLPNHSSLVSESGFAKDVIIDCEHASVALNLENKLQVTVDGITILHGKNENGGAVYIASSSEITLKGVSIANSSASNYGGAVYASNSTLKVRDSYFEVQSSNFFLL